MNRTVQIKLWELVVTYTFLVVLAAIGIRELYYAGQFVVNRNEKVEMYTTACIQEMYENRRSGLNEYGCPKTDNVFFNLDNLIKELEKELRKNNG